MLWFPTSFHAGGALKLLVAPPIPPHLSGLSCQDVTSHLGLPPVCCLKPDPLSAPGELPDSKLELAK